MAAATPSSSFDSVTSSAMALISSSAFPIATQLVILSVGEDSEGEYLDVVEDDETLMEVSKLFEQRLSDQFEIE